jgi:glycosyltransferase involved in cell wall biosynthesis
MLTIAYLTRINFLSDKAHVHTITKTCEALSKRESLAITLVSTDWSLSKEKDLDGTKKQEFFSRHFVEHPFSVVSLYSSANKYKDSPHHFIYSMGTLVSNLSLIAYLWKEQKNVNCIYFRDHLILPAILFGKYILRKKVVYESHYILTKRFGQWLTERAVSVSDGVVAIAVALKEYYSRFSKHIIVAFCTSSEAERFASITDDLIALRKELGLPLGKRLLIYTGNMEVTGNGDSYGVEDIVRALPLLPKDIVFVGIGKKSEKKIKAELLAEEMGVGAKAIFLEWVPKNLIPRYVKAADILLIPSSGAKPGNSPTKMFEYLAAGRPIVAANTEPIAEVLHDEKNALLVEYTKPEAWQTAIERLFRDESLRARLVAQARQDATLYTWDSRAEDIHEFILAVSQ